LNIILPVLSGLLLAASFPKLSLWPLAWVALAPFYYALINSKTMRAALVCGLLFGLVFFGLNLFWLTSLTRFVGGWAWAAWGALAFFQALFIVLLVFLFVAATFRSPSNGGLKTAATMYRPLLFSLLWVAIEWLRAQGPFGVPAGVAGYSQAPCLPLIQIASFAGVYGVSFLVVFFNVALAEIFLDRKRWVFLVLATLLIAASCFYGNSIIGHLSLDIGHLPKLALIQPNIDQLDKMNPRLVMPIYQTEEEMTRQAAQQNPEIIVWPETAVFAYLLRDPVLAPRVRQLARETGAWLVIGTPDLDQLGRAYNSLVVLSPSGEVVSIYNKERLVPFGEYLPFRVLLYPYLKGTGYFDATFTAGTGSRPISVGKHKVAAAICFESMFSGAIKQRAGQNADFILTVTNDAWFGDSAAPYDHLAAGIFRAIENRKYFVQDGNSGFSAVIDPCGRVLAVSELNSRTVVSIK
jgi:apolipoprotein N-acyltransferase